MVGIDLYVNETLAHCDYVLPAATMYERDDFPLPFQTLQPTPFRQATEAVIAPAGQARAGMGDHRRPDPSAVASHPGAGDPGGDAKGAGALRHSAHPAAARRRHHPAGERRRPVRAAPRRADLRPADRRAPARHGAGAATCARACSSDIVVYRGARVRLRHDEIAAEIDKLSRRSTPDGYPMRLIGMREARSENSWMHNAPLLMRGDRAQRRPACTSTTPPRPASTTATWCGSRSPHGEIELPAIADQGHRRRRHRRPARLGPQGHRRLAGRQRRRRRQRQPADVQRARGPRGIGGYGAAHRRAGARRACHPQCRISLRQDFLTDKTERRLTPTCRYTVPIVGQEAGMGQQFMLWLGAGVVTAGVSGAMFAGAGVAAADTESASDSGGPSSSESAQSNGSKADSPGSGLGAKQRRGAQSDSGSNSGGASSESAEPSESQREFAYQQIRQEAAAGEPSGLRAQTAMRRTSPRPRRKTPPAKWHRTSHRALRRTHHRAVRGSAGPTAGRRRSGRGGPDGDGPVRHQGASGGPAGRRRPGGPADARRTGQGAVGTGNRGCVVDEPFRRPPRRKRLRRHRARWSRPRPPHPSCSR